MADPKSIKEHKPRRFVRRPEVLRRTGFSTSTLYDQIAKGKFPRGVLLSPRLRVWPEDEIDRWQDSAINGAGNASR
jgi:prophage regulatory protein